MLAADDIPLLANTDSYRPRVIEGGRRHNRVNQALRFGWPWVSDSWVIRAPDDGVLTWHHGHDCLRVTPGCWLLHPADRVYSWGMASLGARWAQLRFHITHDRSELALNDLHSIWGAPLPLLIPAPASKRFRPLLDDILDWWWKDPWFQHRADVRLADLLVELAQHAHQTANAVSKSTPAPQHAQRSKDHFAAVDILLERRPQASLDELAAACAMSTRSFRRHFEQTRGCTPGTYVNTVRLQRARDLLRDQPSLSVAAIAKQLGYAQVAAFSRAFRSQLGLSPQSWRKRKQSIL